MEPVAQRNKRQGHDMMPHKLLEVLPPLLQAEQHDNGLLRPVRGLDQVIHLELRLVRLVREVLIHPPRVEVPDGRAAHHPDARGAHDAKVHGRVHLLHEALLLAARVDARGAREGPEELLHDELAREGQDDGVKGDERNVPEALAVLRRGARLPVESVGGEDEAPDGVRVCRVESVGRAEGDKHEERDGPGVPERKALEAAQGGRRLSALRGPLVLAQPAHRAGAGLGPPARWAIFRRCRRQPVGWAVEDRGYLRGAHLGAVRA